jgi:transposase InsO family protein
VRAWLGRIGVKTLFIEPGSPWENGYCESFNSKLRDELLAGELFSTLYIERSRRPYNYHKTASPARLPAAGAGDGLAVSVSARLRFDPASRGAGHQRPGSHSMPGTELR